MNFGTNHLAYFNGTACPITLPYQGIPWLKMAKKQFEEGLKIDSVEEQTEMYVNQLRILENRLNTICGNESTTTENIEKWCSYMGMHEDKICVLWYMNVYILQHHLGYPVDNNFGIMHIETQNKKKKQKVNDQCGCGSSKKYKKCCMNK